MHFHVTPEVFSKLKLLFPQKLVEQILKFEPCWLNCQSMTCTEPKEDSRSIFAGIQNIILVMTEARLYIWHKPQCLSKESTLQGPSWNYMKLILQSSSSIISLFAHKTAKFFHMKDRVWRKLHSSCTFKTPTRSQDCSDNRPTHTKVDWVFLSHSLKHLRFSFYWNYQYDFSTNYLTYTNLNVSCVLLYPVLTVLYYSESLMRIVDTSVWQDIFYLTCAFM